MSIDRLQDNRSREQHWRNVQVRIGTNLGYQQMRRNILERRESLIKVISLVAATSAFLDVRQLIGAIVGSANLQAGSTSPFAPGVLSQGSSASPAPSLWLAIPLLIIVVANIWGLVFQWGLKARDASRRFDAWSGFSARVLKVGLTNFTEDDLRLWSSEMADLSVGEAKVNHYLMRRAEREARRVWNNPRKSDSLQLHGLEKLRRDLSNFTQYVPRMFVALP